MRKTLLNSKEDFLKFLPSFGSEGVSSPLIEEYPPTSYPTVLVWEVLDSKNGGWDLNFEFIYLSDFEK